MGADLGRYSDRNRKLGGPNVERMLFRARDERLQAPLTRQLRLEQIPISGRGRGSSTVAGAAAALSTLSFELQDH